MVQTLIFYVKTASTPPEKSHPSLSPEAPSKNWDLFKPPLFWKFGRGSTPPPAENEGGGGVHTMILF